MEVAGRDGSAYLVVDGPVGAIVGRNLPAPIIMPVASILAHREFDPYDGTVPGGLVTQKLIAELTAAREAWDAS